MAIAKMDFVVRIFGNLGTECLHMIGRKPAVEQTRKTHTPRTENDSAGHPHHVLLHLRPGTSILA